ncbi:hypothetical protein LCGC14_1153290, partial [marine sediment metagenome]
YPEDHTKVIIPINTFSSNDPSASVTVTNLLNTDVHIHKEAGVAPRNNAAGITMSLNHDGITGNHLLTIDTSDNTVAGFYVTGKEYQVRIEGATVDAGTINAFVGSFSIERAGGTIALLKLIQAGTITNAAGADVAADIIALKAVVGALNDVAAAGEVTDADTLVQYNKQLLNVLIGAAGIGTFPAEAAPANAVSLAEVIRAIHADVTGLNGDVMVGTDGANTTVPDAAGVAPTVAEIQAEMEENGASVLDTIRDAIAHGTYGLSAIRTRGDAAWITGGSGGITDILNVQPLIPTEVDLADTSTVRLALGLTNLLDDLPSTVEITPGTITIDRKAIGGTSWSNIVNAAACSEAAGLIYYDEVFDSGTGYAEGDSIRITFKGQKITVAANDYEITDSTGWIFQIGIRQTIRLTAARAAVLTEWINGGRLDNLLDTAAAGGGGSSGAGAITWTYTLTDSGTGLPIADVTVWVTTDVPGVNVIASGITNANGIVTFYLDAGTVYVWRQKSGYNFTNPDTETVV